MEKSNPSKSSSTRCRIICVSSIALGVLLLLSGLAVALVLILIVFKPSTNVVSTSRTSISTPSTSISTTALALLSSSGSVSDNFASSIAANTTFPNGSYSLKLSSLTIISNSLNPLQVNSTLLQNAGITEDASNNLVVSGRQNFYYVRIPAVTANSSYARRKRAAEDPLKHNRLVDFNLKIWSAVFGIGIQFGSTDQLNVVTTVLTSKSNSGVRSITLSDGSTLYEIKASAPSNMCSVSATSCTPFVWTAYAIMSDEKTVAVGCSTTVYASCGDQCSSGISSTCSQTCQICSSQTVSGQETPVSRQFYMGTLKGSLNFQYETYGVKDRILIVYENNNIFDSGCVETMGLISKNISFSGQSAEIRVDVEPNCEGTTGTAWYYIIGCPSLCAASSGKTTGQMIVSSDQKVITDGATVFISTLPAMPALKAEYCVASTIPSWTINFEPLSVGNMATICKAQQFTATGSWIDITKIINAFLGGKFTVKVTAGGSSQTLTFTILGKNPDRSVVEAYIGSQTTLWYAKAVANYETANYGHFAQFMSTGLPVRDDKNGYGVYQITKDPKCEQIWNWKVNVVKGIERLTNFRYGLTRTEAQGWMNIQRAQAKQDNNNIAVPVQKVTEPNTNCVFEENTSRTIEDAVAMKMFNGAASNYCAWDNAARAWKINNLKEDKINYVSRVCKYVN